jgi:branched-chain amino acid transport system substrate-binding protein
MKQAISQGNSTSRRKILIGAAASGAALAVGFPAPALLAQTKAPLRIGFINTFTGPLTYAGDDNLAGMGLYFDRIGWTSAGRKIEIIKEDDQFNSQIGLEKAKKLTESDHVDLLTGITASNVAFAVLTYVKQTKSFLIISGAGSDALTWNPPPYLFRTTLTAWQLCHPIGEWMYDNVAKEMALAASDYVGGHDVLRSFKTAYVGKGGKILLELYPPLGTTDFSPFIVDLASVNPQATYDFMSGQDGVRFVRQYAESGLKKKAPIAGFGGFLDNTLLAAIGDAARGLLASTIYIDTLDNPENLRLVAECQAKFKRYPSAYTDYGFVTARVIDETMKAVDGDTSNKDKFAEAMMKVAFDAPRGPFRFDPTTHNPIENVYICQVEPNGDRLAGKIVATVTGVRDPGKKEG